MKLLRSLIILLSISLFPIPGAFCEDESAILKVARKGSADFIRVFYQSAALGKRQAYALYVPDTYDPKKASPVVVFLHSYWDRYEEKQWLRVTEIPGTIQDQCRERGWIAVCPEAGGNSWYYGPAEQQVLETVDEVKKHLNVDPNRLLLIGRSMGGAGALTIGMHNPKRVMGIVALAPVTDYTEYAKGGADPSVAQSFKAKLAEKPDVYASMSAMQFIDTLKKIPVYLIHGEADPIIPFSNSQKLSEALKKAEGNVKFVNVPNEKHNMEMIEYYAADYFKFCEEKPSTVK
jgi:dipeptidyl aminopeptidase/acylaminoacyl peptidase